MTKPLGTLTMPQLTERVEAGAIDTVLVVVTDLYGRFMGKRFDGRFFLEHVAAHGTHACDYLLTVDMEMDQVAGYRFANWVKGYGDIHLVPDLTTLRVSSWLDRTAMVLCDVVDDRSHCPVANAPRSMLRRQIAAAAQLGYTVKAASELEYYTFRQPFREAAGRDYHGLEPAGWYIEDYHVLQGTREEPFHGAVRRHLAASGVPVESTKGEWGKGQHEVNICYAEVLDMADRHVVLKQCVKELAESMQLSVTFMAKFAEDRAGSSCHVHLSLWEANHNRFADDTSGESDVFRWFLGGWLHHMPDLMPFYAPTINSYKRFQPGSWAPTRLAWSHDNRTAGFRIVGSGRSLRIECRVPGADCNPYLVYAAALASGLDGVQNRIEPPAVFRGDAYNALQSPHVPRTLRDATDLLERSQFARLALGEDVVEHYVHFFRTEQQYSDRAVTDWERRRYFERI